MIKNVFITGSSGFVGSHIVKFNPDVKFKKYIRYNEISIEEDAVFHFAGLAHNSHDAKHLNQYLKANYEFTKDLFKSFVNSSSKVFIFLSSIKAVKNNGGVISEEGVYESENVYGLSKAKAEKFLMSKVNHIGKKKIFILRPSLIFGEKNKGNLGTLQKLVALRMPWVFSDFDNVTSLLDIRNLNHVLHEFCNNFNEIPSGIYNVSNQDNIMLKDLNKYIAEARGIHISSFSINRELIKLLFSLGHILKLPFLNKPYLDKIIQSQNVCTKKLNKVIDELPYKTKEGVLYHFDNRR